MKKKINIIVFLSIFIAVASVLNIIEGFIPHPVPWLKFGLANIVTIIGLIGMGKGFAFKVALGRVLLSSILIGTFMTPTFYLSLSGAFVSCIAMITVYRPLGRISPIGVSIFGAVTHGITQLVVVYVLFIRHEGILLMLPIIVVVAVFSGMVNGYIALKIIPMIAEYVERRIFIASSSPRRIDILTKAGLPVIAVKHKAAEDSPKINEDPIKFSINQARKKIESVWRELQVPGCVVTSDTVVESMGKIFIKPKDEEDAKSMLKSYGGSIQKVHTAVIMKNLTTLKELEIVETTELKMKKFTEQELEELKGRHLDKAGGYAIQGMDDKYIQWLKGSYTNVVGFPIEVARKLFKEIWS